MENNKANKNVKPCEVVKTGRGVQVSIYANAVKDSTVPLFKATVERRYVDKKREWKTVRSFSEDELLAVAATAQTAWFRMCELRKAAWQEASKQSNDEVSEADEDAEAYEE